MRVYERKATVERAIGVGVLVFALLVIPPVAALLLTAKPAQRLALGWTIGFVGALVGVAASVAMDLPAGPAVIATLTSLLVLVAGTRGLARRRS